MFNQIISQTEKLARQKIKLNNNDYKKDGLIYCGNCHTPKQVLIKLLGEPRIVWCECDCEKEKTKKEIEQIKKEQAKGEIRANRYEAFAGSGLIHCTFTTDDGSNPEIITIAKNYVDNFKQLSKKNKGLCFFGECDTGKTFATACIINGLIDNGYTAKLVTFNDIDNNYRECLYSLQKYDLLAIDDFGSQRNTSYMNELVFSVINTRYQLKKPLIITSNLTADDFKNPQNMEEKRIYSRIIEMCLMKKCEGKQHRKNKYIEDYKKYKDLLHL